MVPRHVEGRGRLTIGAGSAATSVLIALGAAIYSSLMASTYSVAQAQSQLPGLIKRAESGESVAIRRRDETVAFLVSRERMEALVETLEILANPDAMKAIQEHREGRTKFVSVTTLDD